MTETLVFHMCLIIIEK